MTGQPRWPRPHAIRMLLSLTSALQYSLCVGVDGVASFLGWPSQRRPTLASEAAAAVAAAVGLLMVAEGGLIPDCLAAVAFTSPGSLDGGGMERSDRSEPTELTALAMLDTLAALDMPDTDADMAPAPDPTLSGGTGEAAATASGSPAPDALISLVFGIT